MELRKLKTGFRDEAKPRAINVLIAIQADDLASLRTALKEVEADIKSSVEGKALGGSCAGDGKRYSLHQQHQIGDGGDAYFKGA